MITTLYIYIAFSTFIAFTLNACVNDNTVCTCCTCTYNCTCYFRVIQDLNVLLNFYLDLAGKLFPYHFVRPQEKDPISQFFEDLGNKRLSVTTPFDVLQKSESSEVVHVRIAS